MAMHKGKEFKLTINSKQIYLYIVSFIALLMAFLSLLGLTGSSLELALKAYWEPEEVVIVPPPPMPHRSQCPPCHSSLEAAPTAG